MMKNNELVIETQGLNKAYKYPNMRYHDAKALTCTSPALSEALNITGHPIVHLWLSTSAPDLDIYYWKRWTGAGIHLFLGGQLASFPSCFKPSAFQCHLPAVAKSLPKRVAAYPGGRAGWASV